MASLRIDDMFFARYMSDLADLLALVDVAHLDVICEAVWGAINADAKLYIAGNGGSAATASHLTSDLLAATTCSPDCGAAHVGPTVASLSANNSVTSSIANDHGFEQSFSRQVAGRLRARDLVLIISVSGTSPNVVELAAASVSSQATVIALTGKMSAPFVQATHQLAVPSRDFGYVEDVHLAVAHALSRRIKSRWQRDCTSVPRPQSAADRTTSR